QRTAAERRHALARRLHQLPRQAGRRIHHRPEPHRDLFLPERARGASAELGDQERPMRFTIKLKLFLAFGFIMAMLAGTAGYGIVSLGGLNATLGDVLTGPATR